MNEPHYMVFFSRNGHGIAWHRLAQRQAKLEKETREELATLEAKNRSLSHQLVLLQQEDEAQARLQHLLLKKGLASSLRGRFAEKI